MDTTVFVSNEVVEDLDNLTVDELKDAANQALSRPSNFMSGDSDLWVTHTLMFATVSWNLSDEDIVGESNYRAILRDYSEKYPEDVEDFSFSHWTYSRYNAIKVRVIDENGSVTKVFAELFSLNKQLSEEYPLYDENLHSELGYARFDEYLDQLIDTIERDREYENETSTEITLSDSWKDQFRQFIWDSGEAETGGREDHVSDSLQAKAIEHADSGWTMAQRRKVEQLCWRYKAEFRYSDYRRYADNARMMASYVEGWVGGQETTIYVGVSPEGDSHS